MTARLVGIALLLPSFAWAACSGSSPTWTTDGNEKADVDECVTAASSGDTINVIAGDGAATWASAVVLPSNKDLTIVGPTAVTCSGTEGTTGYSCSSDNALVVTCNSGCFSINLAASHTISGFTMTGGSGERINCSTGNQASGKHFRIHHNRLVSTAGWAPIRCYGDTNGLHPQGIWDHNRFEDVAVHANGTDWQFNEAAYQNDIWAVEPSYGGTVGVVFTEANYWASTATNATDGNYSCRRVERFNHVAEPGIWDWEIHGMQGENRGCQQIEAYYNAHSGSATGGFSEMRGGSGYYFKNSIVSGRTGVNLTIDRSEYDEVAGNFGAVKECGVGGADGNSPSGVDQQTTGENGWRCRDQVGTSHDASTWTSTAGGAPYGAWNQVQRPVYFWQNTEGAGAMTIDVNLQGDIENKIVVNREFYCDDGHSTLCSNGVRIVTFANLPASCTTGQAAWVTDRGKWRKDTSASAADGVLYRCSPDNTWSAWYIPYQYPHNWVDGDDQPSDMDFGGGSGTSAKVMFLMQFAALAILTGAFYVARRRFATRPSAALPRAGVPRMAAREGASAQEAARG